VLVLAGALAHRALAHRYGHNHHHPETSRARA
jgi:hypothetical protein